MFSIADHSLTTDWDIGIHIWSYPDDRLLKILDFLENNDYITLRKFGRFHFGKRKDCPVTVSNHIYHINEIMSFPHSLLFIFFPHEW